MKSDHHESYQSVNRKEFMDRHGIEITFLQLDRGEDIISIHPSKGDICWCIITSAAGGLIATHTSEGKVGMLVFNRSQLLFGFTPENTKNVSVFAKSGNSANIYWDNNAFITEVPMMEYSAIVFMDNNNNIIQFDLFPGVAFKQENILNKVILFVKCIVLRKLFRRVYTYNLFD